MINLATLFWLVLVSAAGFAMFAVKYQVQSLEDELNRTTKETIAEEHAIRMDEVEWAYLTRPETLEQMNQRHLSLMPIATMQLRGSLADIPLRPSSPPPVEEVVASAEPPGENAPVPLAVAPPQTPAEAAQAPPTPVQTTPQAASAIPAQAPEIAKPVAAKAVAKPAAPRHPKTLDDLIAQIAASR
jgi:hypothetical protein